MNCIKKHLKKNAVKSTINTDDEKKEDFCIVEIFAIPILFCSWTTIKIHEYSFLLGHT